MTTYLKRIVTVLALVVLVTIAIAAPSAKLSTVNVQNSAPNKLVNELAVHPEVAAISDKSADLGYPEDGNDFDMDVDSRELDTNEMNNEGDAGMYENGDVDMDVGVHQLDTTKPHDADVNPDEAAPAAANADIEDSERLFLLGKHRRSLYRHKRRSLRRLYRHKRRFLRRRYKYGRGYGFGGRFGRFGRGGRSGRFGSRYPYGRGYYGRGYYGGGYYGGGYYGGGYLY